MENLRMLAYWAKNPYWGGSCVPVIIESANDTLKILDEKMNPIAELAINGAKINLTKFGTLQLITSAKRYNIVGLPAKLSPLPSKEQLACIPDEHTEQSAAIGQNIATAGVGGIGAGNVLGGAVSGAGAAAAIVGSAVELKSYIRAVHSMEQFAKELAARGVNVSYSTNLWAIVGKSALGIILYVGVLAIVFVVALLLYSMTHSNTATYIWIGLCVAVFYFALSRTGYFKRD